MRKNFGPKTYLYALPVLIVGSYDEGGRANAMTAAWGTISNLEPPCVVLYLDSEHKTVKNIRATGFFTVSPATANSFEQADYLGLVHGHNVDKIASCGLHERRAETVNAPIFDEFPMSLECRAIEIEESGDCVRVKGEILAVTADETILDEGGKIDPAKLAPVSYDPVNHAYLALGAKVGNAFHDGAKFIKK